MKGKRPSARRSYDQYCAMIRGLDLVGDRWALPVVRDLLLGPKRYSELLDGLPGIGTNLLATRLRELEALGVVERAVLPPPAGSSVYRLTEAGAALEPVIMSIARWGARYLGARRPTDRVVPTPFFLAMRASFSPDEAAGLDKTYEIRVDRRVFEVQVRDGRCSTREGPVTAPDVVMAMDVETLYELLFAKVSAATAVRRRRVEFSAGALSDLERFIRIFSLARVAALARK